MSGRSASRGRTSSSQPWSRTLHTSQQRTVNCPHMANYWLSLNGADNKINTAVVKAAELNQQEVQSSHR